MNERTLVLKKRILSRVVRVDDPQLLGVVDLLLERAEEGGDASPATCEAILHEVARVLRGGRGTSN
jgi:hypothetical protein